MKFLPSNRNKLEEPRDVSLKDPGQEVVQVICQICKDPSYPVLAVMPAEGELFRDEFERLASKLAAHDACLEKLQARHEANRIMSEHDKRLQSWDKMCPDEFKKPLELKGKRRTIYEMVMRWSYSESGLLLTGPSGRCKTRFAYKVLEREHNKEKTVGGWTHADFRSKITALASVDMEQATRFVLTLARLDLLLLDDLGKGRRTPASEEALFMLVDKRVRDCKPTIYTMNTSLDVFSQQCSDEYRDALIRRIEDRTLKIEF